jgi:hypothetical protein
MTEYDELEFTVPASRVASGKGTVCRRHVWVFHPCTQHPEGGCSADESNWRCGRCQRPKDVAVVRRGKNARERGLSIQRRTLARMGLRHIPGSQLLDGDNDAFTAEVKSGGRFSESDWHEVNKQRAVSGARMPLLVKVETPGAGRRARGTVTVDLDDWIAHYGPATVEDAA